MNSENLDKINDFIQNDGPDIVLISIKLLQAAYFAQINISSNNFENCLLNEPIDQMS